MRDQSKKRVGAALLRHGLGERIEPGIGALVHEEARNVRSDLELLSLVGGDLEVEQMTLLTEMVGDRVPWG